jgi:hypothetical protein
MKFLALNERRKARVATIIEGETGVGKTSLLRVFSEMHFPHYATAKEILTKLEQFVAPFVVSLKVKLDAKRPTNPRTALRSTVDEILRPLNFEEAYRSNKSFAQMTRADLPAALQPFLEFAQKLELEIRSVVKSFATDARPHLVNALARSINTLSDLRDLLAKVVDFQVRLVMYEAALSLLTGSLGLALADAFPVCCARLHQ